MQNIAIVDKGFPITSALNHAYRTVQAPEPTLSVWRKELESMVREAATKFVGFQNIDSVRRALDIVLGVLSLSIMHRTKGQIDPDKWVDHLLANGLKGAATEVVSLIKQLTTESPFAEFLPSGTETGVTVRQMLIDCALDRRERQHNNWTGYQRLTSEIDVRKEARNAEALAKWMIVNVVKCKLEIWLDMHTFTDKSAGPPMPPDGESATNTIMFRYCADLSLRGNIELKKDALIRVRAEYERSKPRWMKAAKDRYDQLVQKIPAELRPALSSGKDWFKAHLGKGPPKVTKKTRTLRPEGPLQGYMLKFY